MAQHILVIGGGIIGAALACRASGTGARVTVLEAGGIAGAASGRSFGWINASFFADHDHFRLRAQGIAAWHRLADQIGPLPINWQGSLWWEEQGAAFDRMAAELTVLGYPSSELNGQAFAARAPHLANPPERALFLPGEGAADTAALTETLLRAAMEQGAQVMTGVRAVAIAEAQGRVRGVMTDQGLIAADHVVVAAGTGTPDLVSPLGVAVPMLRRPGVLMMTGPVARCLDHVMVAPGQEFRQLPDGRILAPTSAAHQGDDSDAITEHPAALGAQTLDRLRGWLPGVDLTAQQMTLAWRPVPVDGLPVVGAAGPTGLYLAVMHSGVTLAAIIAELAVQEIMQGHRDAVLRPYDPARLA